MSEVTNRRRAREVALQVLFQKEFVPDIDFSTSLAYFRDRLEIPKESCDYAQHLLNGIEKHSIEIDKHISEKSRNWKISRIAPVDLCLLRLGVFELCFGDNEVPPKVVIDEAIEIAKRYGGTETPNFINGILDEIWRAKT
ncbi:MAG: transcription antitermination factor NusB [Bdellovibrionales bacterium RBG_16_40_8]|nr:MAG: transcription antitermination factor NusB [Bdellovibrionales bacterium RBG_16_40_8]